MCFSKLSFKFLILVLNIYLYYALNTSKHNYISIIDTFSDSKHLLIDFIIINGKYYSILTLEKETRTTFYAHLDISSEYNLLDFPVANTNQIQTSKTVDINSHGEIYTST